MKITDPFNHKVSFLEAELARENQILDAAMAPVEIEGRHVYSSPGDGYWKKRWHLENKLTVARALRDAVREVLS